MPDVAVIQAKAGFRNVSSIPVFKSCLKSRDGGAIVKTNKVENDQEVKLLHHLNCCSVEEEIFGRNDLVSLYSKFVFMSCVTICCC